MEDVTQEYYHQKETMLLQKPSFLPFDKVLFFSNIKEIEERYHQISKGELLPRFITNLDTIYAWYRTKGKMEEYNEYVTLNRQRNSTKKFNNNRILGIINDVTLENMTHIHGKNMNYVMFKIYDHMRNDIDGIIITGCFDRHDDQETLTNSYYLNGKETPLQILFHAQPILFSDITRTYIGKPVLRIKHIEIINDEEDILL